MRLPTPVNSLVSLVHGSSATLGVGRLYINLTGATVMYVSPNFKTKKALKEAVARGERVVVFAPGLGTPDPNGTNTVEGPHYPEPHRWYANVKCENAVVVSVK